ncbi:hypothetical protein SPSYN_03029 [Sporotomaculum syntrophicum]|uniref:Uncharacterized protein n=1 Tax=Sporotomaculum syntrophicum TaxID=182264 RepID=A0A9D2WME6_9FIRM|nr:hypothetical protein SPSYN_03029 [Sporotomaculum syntrophicum]
MCQKCQKFFTYGRFSKICCVDDNKKKLKNLKTLRSDFLLALLALLTKKPVTARKIVARSGTTSGTTSGTFGTVLIPVFNSYGIASR